eukprot:2907900-Lingulodinium_polyedra.AAC.1
MQPVTRWPGYAGQTRSLLTQTASLAGQPCENHSGNPRAPRITASRGAPSRNAPARPRGGDGLRAL